MKRQFLTAAAALGLTIASALMLSGPEISGEQVAGRYHLRTRTSRFFERATPSGRELHQQRQPQRNAPNVERPTQHEQRDSELPQLFFFSLSLIG